MAFVIVEKGSDRDVGKRFTVGEKAVVIGRRTPQFEPEIALEADYVSRRHAEIVFERGRFVLRDLGSANGTTLDDERLTPGQAQQLRHDSVVGIGVTGGSARVLLRFKLTPTMSTVRIEMDRTAPPGWLRLDEATGEVWVDGKPVILSRKEYDLMAFLAARKGKLCTRDELIASVWPEALDPAGVADAAVDQLVHRLRLKIEQDPARPARLVSRKGFGFLLAGLP
jgi:pSer/pThr/pTyr-binding forkhead associated (FHA) protein